VKTLSGQRFGTVFIKELEDREHHRLGRGTADQPGRNVRQKTGLNRSILDQGWVSFETLLA
jgi:putative transposase